MNGDRKECTCNWFIENYSYCCHKNGKSLDSPKFTADGFEGTVWKLRLYPRGQTEEVGGFISLFLHRCKVDDGPVDFFVNYELSILAENGLSASHNSQNSFQKGKGWGSGVFLKRDKALLHRKVDYLPQDTLRVQCKIWKGEGNVQKAKKIKARTRIGIEEISYLHSIENFTTLQPEEKKEIEIKSHSLNHLTSKVYFVTDPSEGNIILEIIPFEKNHTLTKYKISLLDRNGKKIECGEADNRLDASRKDIQNVTLSLTRKAILDAKSDYLSDDNLTLECECVFSTGVELEKIEKTVYEKPFVAYTPISDAQSKGIYNASEKLSACPKAMDDLKAIYSNQFLTDVEIETKSKSFHAHKAWLCARSPVFHKMLTSDMREKNSGIIPIDDLEDDTVQQLLAFLYTDEVEELCWESAIKLYYAGDRYQVERLKVICASFLVDNVSATSASELLVLADTHSDSDLKEAVEDFILRHEEEVFGSEEWNKLTKVNPQLALETMLLKYNRKVMYFSETSNAQYKGKNNASQKLSASPSAMDHLKAIFKEQLHSDVELKTATKSFHAHKAWLCARSPVFETMLSSDMREKNSNIIPIDDLEDDTLQQFLAFMYADEVEDLCWKSATKLYYAADKYQIERLKVICSSFLVDNITTTSASELLVLADTHSDSDLKETVEDFILEHEEGVFGSEEWNKLTKVNPQLALETMLLKYNRKVM